MRRREFIAGIGSVAAWPLASAAQPTARPVVGVLLSVSSSGYDGRIRAYQDGLKETGYIDGQNVTLELRWAEGRTERLSALAAELVSQRVSVIAALGGPFPAVAAKGATKTIPIVFGTPDDPVRLGLVQSLARPGSDVEIDAAFKLLSDERPDAVFIAPDPFFKSRRPQLVEFAARLAVPASYSVRDFCESGGLMSYGADINDGFRQAGIYIGRVLKGEKPAEIPVVQATKIEFVINIKTARALGLEIHPQLLATADEVLE